MLCELGDHTTSQIHKRTNWADFDLLNTRLAMWELVILKNDFDIFKTFLQYSLNYSKLETKLYLFCIKTDGKYSAVAEESL